MQLLSQIRKHPLPFLLYVEWAILFFIAIDEAFIFPMPRPEFCKIINLIGIAIFLLLGLNLPWQENKNHKLTYVWLLMSLLILVTIAGKINLYFLLFTILFIRVCLLFPEANTLLITLLFVGFYAMIDFWRPLPFTPPPPPFAHQKQHPHPPLPPALPPPFAVPQPPPPPPPDDRFRPHPPPPPDHFRPYPPPDFASRERPPFPPPPFGSQEFQEKFALIIWSSRCLIGIVLVFMKILISTVLSEQKSRQELAVAHEKLRHYSLKVENLATLEERNRIAREIHDSLGHYLTVLNINLEAAWKLHEASPEESLQFLAESKKLGSQALQEVRESVAALRIDPLKNKNLPELIKLLGEEFKKTTGIMPIVNFHLSQAIPNEVKTATYRIVQESLTNIYKYAQATEVKITLSTDTSLHIIIEDDGIGFIVDQNTTGFGLQGMRERALALGGKFIIVSAPKKGCQLMASIPL